MFDRVLVFTRTGLVLWSLSFLPLAANELDPTTAVIAALCREVLLPQRAPGTSLAVGPLAVKWSASTEFDIVVAAVFAKAFAQTLGNIDDLLLATQRAFVATYRERLASGSYTGGVADGFDFESKFNALLDVAERRAAADKKGGIGPSSRLVSGAPSPAAQSPAQQQRQQGAPASATAPAPSSPAPAASGAGTAASGAGTGAAEEQLTPAQLAANRERLRKLGAAGGGKAGGGRSAAAAPGPSAAAIAAGKAAAAASARGFKYDPAEAARLDRGKTAGGAGDDVDVSSGVVQVQFSGTGASGSGRALYDEDDEDEGAGAAGDAAAPADWAAAAFDAASADLAAAAPGGGGGGGAAAATSGGVGGLAGAVTSWFTRSAVGSFLTSLTGSRVLDAADVEPVLASLREHLIGKNVAPDIAGNVCAAVGAQLVGQRLEAASSVARTVTAALRAAIGRILAPGRDVDLLAEVAAKKAAGAGPYVVAMVGVNGVGKSTTLAKLAFLLRDHGHSVLIAACDSFRAGAVEQLKRHCAALSVPLFSQGYDKDPVLIARAAIKAAREGGAAAGGSGGPTDVVLVDTAGRMTNNGPLMQQLAKLVAVNSPDLVLFVGEALVGNDGVAQLVEFDRALVDYAADRSRPRRIDGIVLTKFDTIDDKVGAALSMVHRTSIPIAFLGVGQHYGDLRRLNAAAVVRALMA